MFKYFCITIVLLLSLGIFFVPKTTFAEQNGPNNKFGIHLAQPHETDIRKAAQLLNSSGGDWGYITVVMEEKDRDKEKWQRVFDQMREYHLIPIVRLATSPEGAKWRRPSEDDAPEWIKFLDSLNWVIKKRYIILFNEPNHGTEWGGLVDAVQYAHIAQAFAEKLKTSNADYNVMLAGLDASAPAETPYYADEADFLSRVVEIIGSDKMNRLFDGLSSHSYPNPGFVGSPNGSGRGTVRTYVWEKNLLKSLGIKDLPVFITETGWDGTRLSRDTVASDFEHAFLYVWLPDQQVVAVTPFVLNYQTDPFLPFSWITVGEGDVYPQYTRVQSLPKQIGKPAIDQKGTITSDVPVKLVEQSDYEFSLHLKNEGQGFWDKKNGYSLQVAGLDKDEYYITGFDTMKPGSSRNVGLFINTQKLKGHVETKIQLLNRGDVILELPWNFDIVSFPSLTLKINLYPKLAATGDDYNVQIFNDNEKLIFEKDNLSAQSNILFIEKVANIAPGKQYRIVVRRVPYLPRQTITQFFTGNNFVTMKRMYPFDFTGDGAFTFSDVLVFLRHPGLISFFFP